MFLEVNMRSLEEMFIESGIGIILYMCSNELGSIGTGDLLV